MKNVLITGGAGFIGINLIHYLLEHQYTILNVDKLTYAANIAAIQEIDSPHHRLLVADITDRSAMRDAINEFQPEAIIHLAAESHVDRSIERPVDFIQTNIVGTSVLLEVTTEYWKSLPTTEADQFRFLHCSTDEVYGTLGDEGQFTEQSNYNPRSPYAASKAASDHLVNAWHHTYGLPVIITHASNNYGPYQHPEKLIPKVITYALQGKEIPIYGDGQQIRDWIYVEDNCRGLHLALQKGTPGQVYNFGGNCELRNADLVSYICDLVEEKCFREGIDIERIKITHVQDRPGHDYRYSLNCQLGEEKLGWGWNQGFEKNMQMSVEWYIRNTFD